LRVIIAFPDDRHGVVGPANIGNPEALAAKTTSAISGRQP
jgi:hypothetical protein